MPIIINVDKILDSHPKKLKLPILTHALNADDPWNGNLLPRRNDSNYFINIVFSTIFYTFTRSKK